MILIEYIWKSYWPRIPRSGRRADNEVTRIIAAMERANEIRTTHSGVRRGPPRGDGRGVQQHTEFQFAWRRLGRELRRHQRHPRLRAVLRRRRALLRAGQRDLPLPRAERELRRAGQPG